MEERKPKRKWGLLVKEIIALNLYIYYLYKTIREMVKTRSLTLLENLIVMILLCSTCQAQTNNQNQYI